MKTRRKCRSGWGWIIATLAVAFVGLQAYTPAPPQLIVFEFGTGDDAFPPRDLHIEQTAANALRQTLKSSTDYKSVSFKRTHPSVRRALAEGSLKSALLLPPFTGKADGEFKAIRLAKIMRGQYAVAGNVDQYSYDAEKATTTMVVSIEIYSVSENKLIGAVGSTVTGTGADEIGAGASALNAMAEDLGAKVLAVLNERKDGG